MSRSYTGRAIRRGPASSPEAGFSLLEIMVVVAVVGVLAATALPLRGAFQRSISYAATREISTHIRSARLLAVTANRTMLVRFNCPAAGQYRVVEVTGNAAIDTASDRCSYSYPYPDPDPNVRPNNDGPLLMLPEGLAFGVTQDLQISALGVVTPLTGGMPALIGVNDGTGTRQISVSTSGRIQLP